MGRKRKEDTIEGSTDNFKEMLDSQCRSALISGELQTTAQSESCMIGPRLPYFCLRYLFQRTTFPFSRTTVLYGEPGCNKSSFLYWLYRLFADIGGMYLHLEVETKDSPANRLAMLGHPKADKDPGYTKSCQLMDEYQTYTKKYIDWLCKAFIDNLPPFIIGIDSLMGKMTESAAKVVDDREGVTGKRYASEALSLSDWFKYIPKYLFKRPFCLVGVNHDKPKPGQYANMVLHTMPGGLAPVFSSTYRILFSKVKTIPQNAAGVTINHIKMVMDRNSIASGKLPIFVDIGFWSEVGKNSKGKIVSRTCTAWNWHKASAELLLSISNDNGARSKVVDELIDIKKHTGNLYSSPNLGIPRSDPVKPTEFGKVLESNTELLELLEARLGIVSGREYQIGVPYIKQWEEAVNDVDEFTPLDNASIDAIDDDNVSTESNTDLDTGDNNE